MRAPVCISPSNRSNRSASASVTERDKRLAEKSVEKPVANRAQGLTHFFAFVAGLWCASEPGNGLRATVDRPRAVCGAVVSRVDAAGARSRTCNNLPSLNRVYNYGMISVTCSRPFSELGDQQLLEQTRRLAANQRGIDVHILDHLDEIDRRGLALRRGFSSLFDYAVRELRFTDAAAQRRIQAMRLCRRHGWVRACLQSGELSMTAAGQLETTFAGAERAERQSHTGHRNVGQGCCHDQDHGSAGGTGQLGLPAAPGEAGEQRECGPRSAPELAPRAEQCSDDAAAVNSPVVPVVSYAGAQAPGAGHAGHAGALLQRPELNGHAAPSPAPSCDRAPGAGAGAGAGAVVGPAAPSSDEGPAPQPLPPTDLPAQASAPAPAPVPVLPVAAPSVSLPAASLASEPLRDDPFAELSPGPVSAAPLLHPQRQRELIEQAAGMSTRQVANLLAAAAPEVLPPRDTLRAAAPDRYTLKVSIDQECEQGLRLLKDVMSHVDPRMSWGDLVARVVREAVTRHDPRGGGSGQRRRRSADRAGASPRRAPKETRVAGAAVGPAQRGDESSPRAPNRARAAVAPGAPARRRGSATSAPQGDTATIERQNPIAMLANAAPPRQSAPAALLDGARAGAVPSGAPAATSAPKLAPVARLDGARSGGAAALLDGARGRRIGRARRYFGAEVGARGTVGLDATSAPKSAPALLDGARVGGARSGAPAATSAPKFASGALADGSHAGGGGPGSPVATAAPERALGVSPDRGPSGASDGAAGGASADGFSARAGLPGSPVATAAPERALGVSPDGGPSGASAGAAGGASAAGFSARAGVPGSPVATSAPQPALGVSPDGGPPDASAGAAAHTTREPVHSRHQSPPRRHIPAAVRRHIWQRDGGRCCYRDPLSGRRCSSSHLLQIDHLLPVAQGGGPEPSNLELLCFAHHRMRHGYGPAVPPEPPM